MFPQVKLNVFHHILLRFLLPIKNNTSYLVLWNQQTIVLSVHSFWVCAQPVVCCIERSLFMPPQFLKSLIHSTRLNLTITWLLDLQMLKAAIIMFFFATVFLAKLTMFRTLRNVSQVTCKLHNFNIRLLQVEEILSLLFIMHFFLQSYSITQNQSIFPYLPSLRMNKIT